MQLLIFFLFAGIAVITSIIMISTHKPVNSAIALITTMFCTAAIYAMLDAHLLAAFQLVVYAGAIMILFLFVIMLLHLREKEGDSFERHHIVLQLIILGVFVSAFVKIIGLSEDTLPKMVTETAAGFGSVESAGKLLFTKYLFPFELASIILLVGLVGAIVLAMRGKKRSGGAS